MEYRSFFKTEIEPDLSKGVFYAVFEDSGSYYIECRISGGKYNEKIFLGSCGEEKAENIAHLLAVKKVHPLHIEDIISDMRF